MYGTAFNAPVRVIFLFLLALVSSVASPTQGDAQMAGFIILLSVNILLLILFQPYASNMDQLVGSQHSQSPHCPCFSEPLRVDLACASWQHGPVAAVVGGEGPAVGPKQLTEKQFSSQIAQKCANGRTIWCRPTKCTNLGHCHCLLNASMPNANLVAASPQVLPLTRVGSSA